MTAWTTFAEGEILDMCIMSRNDIIKTILRRLKFAKQEADASSSSSTQASETNQDTNGIHTGPALKTKADAVSKQGMRKN